MARAAIPGGLSARRAWRPGRLLERRVENAGATTLVLEVTDWPGHLPGQHVDVRLTADDGYTATRSYSLAAPAEGDRVEVTVQRVPDGEVSPFLCDDLQVGDSVELRGPVGGWFVWRPGQPEPVLLVAGGAGVVPLMAMLRARPADGPPFRLVYSVRQPDDVIYREELTDLARTDRVEVRYVFTRRGAPDGGGGAGGAGGAGEARPTGRLRSADLDGEGWGPADAPTCYVCGPTGFVEAAATILASAGHDAARIRTERFGPSGS